MKRLLLAALFAAPCINSMEMIPASSSEDVRLLTNHRNMFVEDENAAYRIENHNMNPLMRDTLKHNVVAKLKEHGYFRVTKLDNGEYAIQANAKGLGGGILTAGAVYLGVKVVSYTALMTGVITVNAALPGAGTTATALAMGAGGTAGYVAGTEALALKLACVAAVPWLP